MPRADSLTAIEAYIIVCIVCVFLALLGIEKYLSLKIITLFPEYATILFKLKIQTAQPPSFKKNKKSSVSDVENSFKKIDLDGDGKLTKQEMLRGNEFTQDEVDENITVEIIFADYS
jgi:hypothetical protein